MIIFNMIGYIRPETVFFLFCPKAQFDYLKSVTSVQVNISSSLQLDPYLKINIGQDIIFIRAKSLFLCITGYISV